MIVEVDDSPLEKAQDNYRELLGYSIKLAQASDKHPEIDYDFPEVLDELPLTEDVDYDPDVEESIMDLPLLSVFVSEAWSEAEEYFMFDFEREFREYLHENDFNSEAREREENYFFRLNSLYDALEDELGELNESIEELVDNPPAAKSSERYILTPKNQQVTFTAD